MKTTAINTLESILMVVPFNSKQLKQRLWERSSVRRGCAKIYEWVSLNSSELFICLWMGFIKFFKRIIIRVELDWIVGVEWNPVGGRRHYRIVRVLHTYLVLLVMSIDTLLSYAHSICHFKSLGNKLFQLMSWITWIWSRPITKERNNTQWQVVWNNAHVGKFFLHGVRNNKRAKDFYK